MLTSLSVKNYRGLRDLKIDGLTRVNIIAGENNSGKTSLLEAVALLVDPSPETIASVHRNRRIANPKGNALELVRWMPSGGDTAKIVEIQGFSDDTRERRVSFEVVTREGLNRRDQRLFAQFANRFTTDPRNEAFVATLIDGDESPIRLLLVPEPNRFAMASPRAMRPSRVISSGGAEPHLIEDFSRVKIDQTLDRYLPALKHVEPRLRDLDLANFAGDVQIYGNVGLGRLLPLPLMGEGIGRVLTFVISIASCPGGMVVVDEIENGLHHSILEKVWQAIGEAARIANCQVFATTHSYECIQAAQRAFADNGEEDLAFIRLERRGDDIRAIVADEESLETAIGHRWEMR